MHRRSIDETALEVQQALVGSATDVEVNTWADLDPYYRDVMTMFDDVLRIVMLIVFAVAPVFAIASARFWLPAGEPVTTVKSVVSAAGATTACN